MFKVKQYVNHRYSGVCLVKDISPLLNKPEGPDYYVLEPLYGEDYGSVVRVPVTNQTCIFPILSRKEVIGILKSFKKLKEGYIEDTKLRKSTYEAYIASGQIEKIAQLLHFAVKKRDEEGKCNSLDKQFINKATPIVYGNFSVSLGMPYEKVERYIKKF